MSKSANELGAILSDMYSNAAPGEKVTMIHLFGVQFHRQIQMAGVREVKEASGIPTSYATEVSKGIRLAKYVTPLQLHKA